MPCLGRVAEGLRHVAPGGGQPQRQAAEFGRQAMPQRASSEHRVLAAAYLDGGRIGDRAGPRGVSPGLRGTGDAVSGPVGEEDSPARQLFHRLLRWQPGRQPGDRRHRRVPGHPERRPRPHRVADQHDGNAAEPQPDPVEHPAEVRHGRGQLAVPAPHAVTRPEDHDPGSAQRVPDGERQRDHPQHGRVKRAHRLGAHLGAAVRNDHRTAGAGRRVHAVRVMDRLAAHRPPSPLAARSLSATVAVLSPPAGGAAAATA